MSEKRRRRIYGNGRCGDCGRTLSVTRVKFWLSGLEMLLCAACIKPYRSVLLKPGARP